MEYVHVLNTLLQIEKSEISLEVELRKRIIFEKTDGRLIDQVQFIRWSTIFGSIERFRRAATIERRLYARKMT